MQLPQFNPYARAIKKYLVQVIPHRYTEEVDETAERLVHHLATKQDAERLIRLLGDIYQAGYDRAIESAKEAMKERGMRLKVVPPKKSLG